MISLFAAFKSVFNRKSDQIARTSDSDAQKLRVIAKKKMNELGQFYLITQKLPSYRIIHHTETDFLNQKSKQTVEQQLKLIQQRSQKNIIVIIGVLFLH